MLIEAIEPTSPKYIPEISKRQYTAKHAHTQSTKLIGQLIFMVSIEIPPYLSDPFW